METNIWDIKFGHFFFFLQQKGEITTLSVIKDWKNPLCTYFKYWAPHYLYVHQSIQINLIQFAKCEYPHMLKLDWIENSKICTSAD